MDAPPPDWYYFKVADGRLFGSEHPENLHYELNQKRAICRRIAEFMRSEHKVGAVINLTEHPWNYGIDGLSEYHVPLDDNNISNVNAADIDEIISIVNLHMERSENVWIHCQKGIDRTGCVLGCYLTTVGVDPDDAIETVKQQWPERRKSKSMYHDLWEPSAARIREYAAR